MKSMIPIANIHPQFLRTALLEMANAISEIPPTKNEITKKRLRVANVAIGVKGHTKPNTTAMIPTIRDTHQFFTLLRNDESKCLSMTVFNLSLF